MTLIQEGASIGVSLGGSGGLAALFAYGLTNPSDFRTADVSFDFGISLGVKLGSYLKSLTEIEKLRQLGKLVSGAAKAANEYKKLKYVGENIVESKAFWKPGLFGLPIPGANYGLDLRVGRRASDTNVPGSGVLNFGKH